MSIFTVVLSIIMFFYIRSQKHIIKEENRGFLDDITVVNLNKIREKILKSERILGIEKEKIKLQTRTGEIDSIFEMDNEVILGGRRLCLGAIDSALFFWQEPASSNEFAKDVLDNNFNGILEENEIMNLRILYIRYKVIKDRKSSELSTSIYLRK